MAKHYLSEEDKALFREAMRSVKPLAKTDKKSLKAFSPPLPAQTKTKLDTTITPIYLSNHYSTNIQAESILCYGEQSLPQNRFRQLKYGKIPWQARLDLHGLRVDDARDVLYRFIMQQYRLEHRCVLIIHGKGSHHGEPPVLKNSVNHWLQQIPEILAFHSALPRDGGNGALYTLLKRNRHK